MDMNKSVFRQGRVDPTNQPYGDGMKFEADCRPKDIHHTVGSSPGLSLLYHDPEPVEQSQNVQKQKASMLEASWTMYEDKEQKGQQGSAKKSNSNCMFKSSEDIFGDKAISGFG